MKIKLPPCLLVILVSGFYFSPVQARPSAEYVDIQITPKRNLSAEANNELRVDAAEVADLLRIRPVVEMLRTAQRSGKDMSLSPKAFQAARLMCLWRVFQASEEVRKVVALINFDIAENNIHLETLVKRKQLTSNVLNSVNFLQSGVMGVTKNTMALYKVFPSFRQEIAITSFAMGAGLPLVNMTAPMFITRRAGGPNMLSHVTDPGFKPEYANQSYLWKYFNSPIPGGTSESRREILLKHWEALKGLSTKNEKKRELMAGTNEKAMREGMKMIGQRIDIMHDFKTHIEEFDVALFELHQAITNIPGGVQ